MVWMVRYTKMNSEKKVLTDRIGNFYGGNCWEVILKVCKYQGLHPPKKTAECHCSFKTPIYDSPEEFEYHNITVGSVDTLIDLEGI